MTGRWEGRWDYGAIGTVTNLAARLCGEAKPGQVLISRRLLATVEADGADGGVTLVSDLCGLRAASSQGR